MEKMHDGQETYLHAIPVISFDHAISRKISISKKF